MLYRPLRNVRESIEEVGRYAKYQTLVWMLSLAGIGFVAGAEVTFLYLGSKIDTLQEQVVAIQQQIALTTPVFSPGGPPKPLPKNGHSSSGSKSKPQGHSEPAIAPVPDAAAPPQ